MIEAVCSGAEANQTKVDAPGSSVLAGEKILDARSAGAHFAGSSSDSGTRDHDDFEQKDSRRQEARFCIQCFALETDYARQIHRYLPRRDHRRVDTRDDISQKSKIPLTILWRTLSSVQTQLTTGYLPAGITSLPLRAFVHVRHRDYLFRPRLSTPSRLLSPRQTPSTYFWSFKASSVILACLVEHGSRFLVEPGCQQFLLRNWEHESSTAQEAQLE